MQKERWLVLFLAALVAAGSLGCTKGEKYAVRGAGRVTTETWDVDEFTGVALSTFANLHIERGDREELRIEVEENLLRYFEVEVKDETLRIRTRHRVSLRPTKPVNIYLTVRELDRIYASGSGDVEAEDLESEEMTIRVSGSGDVVIGDLDADELDIQVSGSGNVDISRCEAGEQRIFVSGSGDVSIDEMDARVGKVRITGSGNVSVHGGSVDGQRVTVSGSGDYKAGGLESSEAEVVVSGCGSVTIHVGDLLEATLTGSGDLRYVGRPRVIRTVSGSGDLVGI